MARTGAQPFGSGDRIGLQMNACRPSLAALLLLLAAPALVLAQPFPADIANTRHNLSVTGPGEVKATGESRICVFCHTPHGADSSVGAPLWNRELSQATYLPYDSSSMDASNIQEPMGSSRLCLSCHDGTLALGTVRNMPGRGSGTGTIALTGTDGGRMPAGEGRTTGATRDLGVNLTNDHPISFTFDSNLALLDGELRDPAQVAHLGVRGGGERPLFPLEAGPVGQALLQCTSCHDPHVREPGDHNKFLRVNRFQVVPPLGGDFSETGDQVCLGCHDKLGEAWATSAHAAPAVADQQYTDAAADMRQFPRGLRVWQAGCLNCHNPHTTEGARYLLREATDAPGTAGTPKAGGNAAQEETCYQCHTSPAESAVTGGSGVVPNIRSDFQLAIRKPITRVNPQTGQEAHDVLDADLTETRETLGRGNLDNRHAECTDCHNPHRAMRNALFNATGDPNRRTHVIGGPGGNIASGVLRGSWGVEPVYGGESFFALPIDYQVKRGDGGTGASTAVNSPWVTREYQICLKCHSDYAYIDDNVYPSGNTRPELGGAGLTQRDLQRTAGTYTRYTNQAREFQAPLTHRGNPGNAGTDAGASSLYDNNNHRSWHPVIESTGRTTAVRGGMATNAFLAPWSASIGTNTMYCSDCHGSNTPTGTTEPGGGGAWGPHGSQNNFLLKGVWDTASGSEQGNALCFKCHEQQTYAPTSGGGRRTGFWIGPGSDRGSDQDGHLIHSPRGDLPRSRCNWCHVAVPHGWKNKALLVNLNDVGPEAGLTAGTEVSIPNTNTTYSVGPYYRNAKLKILNFRTSGDWRVQDCGSRGSIPGQGGTGRDWMRNVCDTPP